MKARRVVRGQAWLIAAVLPFALACSNTSDKASGDAAPAVPETPEGYRTHAAQLRREGKPKEAFDAALKAFTLARTGTRVPERIELAKAYAARANATTVKSEHDSFVSGAINEVVSLRKDKEAGAEVDEVHIAEIYALIGDPNNVFRWLERAVAVKSPNLAGIENNPDLESVKTDPRWQQFIASVPRT
jgi:hypothetical protein